LFGLSLVLPGGLYRVALVGQVGFYGLGLVGLWASGRRSPGTALAASFLMLNGAAWVAFWVWIFGRSGQSWQKVAYDSVEPTSRCSRCAGKSETLCYQSSVVSYQPDHHQGPVPLSG
jgi:hypothetical protein